MNREEFLFKKEQVSDILEKNEIIYELIVDYRYKNKFDNIKILVNDFIDNKILSDYFGSIVNIKDNKVKIIYDDIDLIFIKANDSNWINSFYFYSGEIIPIALNKIALKLGLKYTENGLYYIHNVDTPILLTNKVFEIFNFFEVNTKFIIEGFDHLKDIYEFIINSTFFNANIFESSDVNKDDILYDENIYKYEFFIKAISLFKDNTNNCNYNYSDPKNYIDLIDEYFPESKLLLKYSQQNFNKIK